LKKLGIFFDDSPVFLPDNIQGSTDESAPDDVQDTAGNEGALAESLSCAVSMQSEKASVCPACSEPPSDRVIQAELLPNELCVPMPPVVVTVYEPQYSTSQPLQPQHSHQQPAQPQDSTPQPAQPQPTRPQHSAPQPAHPRHSVVKPAELTVAPKGFSMPPDIGRRFRLGSEDKELDADTMQPRRKKDKKVRQWKLPRAVGRMKNTRRAHFRIAVAVIILLVVAIGFSQLFAPFTVVDQAMEDTIKQKERIVVAKAAYWFSSPKYGDIVVYKTPLYNEAGSEKPTVGRIVGLPGDRISIWDGSVYRNGQKLEEPYVKGGWTSSRLNEIVVLEGTYFILGDNRDVSRDSRHRDVGLIAKSQIVGKVVQ